MATSDATTITDLCNPKMPLPFRIMNSISRPLAPTLFSLDEQSLIKAAQKRTGLQNLGDDSFREPLRILLNALEKEANLSSFGRLATRRFIIQLLSSRLILQNMIARHPEILDEKIEKPIIIAGLPRTGTTHLHNLMSCDPGLRYIPYWQSLEPFPPSNTSRKHRPDTRRKDCQRALQFIDYVMPLLASMH